VSGLIAASDGESRAIAFRDAVEQAIILADGDIRELRKLAKQAEAIQEFLQKDASLREAANTIGIARLKIAAAIGASLPREKGGRGKTTKPDLGVSAPTLAKYRKIHDCEKQIPKYEQQVTEDRDVSFADFLRFAKPPAKKPSLPQADNANGEKESSTWSFAVGDCRDIDLPDDSVDLVFCSPPYESQREYGDEQFNLCGNEWVEWATDCFSECLRVCRGLVAWVVEGFTDDFRYSCTPFFLMAELHRKGYAVRKPCVYRRMGIPGTGGPDWLRNDWEPIICATKHGRLPWSHNTAMGTKPVIKGDRAATNRKKDGSRKQNIYKDPDMVNPGNIISGKVGSGQLGWKDAHENEAPFPQWLATFFVRSFCPPGGTVLDPFSGSGTTVAAAVACGRNGIGRDIRADQVWLGETRLLGLTVNERKSGQGVLV